MESKDLGVKSANQTHAPPFDGSEPLHSSQVSGTEKELVSSDLEDERIDNFGLPMYRTRYPLEHRPGDTAPSVLWHKQRPPPHKRWVPSVLCSRQFWRQVEFSLRITIFCFLLTSSLIAAQLPNSPFVAATSTLTSIALAARMTVGESFAYLLAWIRAGCLWLPIATIGGSIYLDRSMAGWYVYYTFFLFVMAALTENTVRRTCLLLFNSCMIGILVNPENRTIYPSRVMVDWCIGVGLCVFAAFVPYPIFCKDESQNILSDISQKTGAAFTGMTSCFWADSNVERNMAMTKVRLLTTAIDALLDKYHAKQDLSFYEFLFERSGTRCTRAAKGQLFERLRLNLRGLARVLDIVETKPWVVDDSVKSKAFGKNLQPHIKNLASSLEKLTVILGECTSFRRLKEDHTPFLEIHECAVRLQHEFNHARRTLFYEHKSDTLEEFVPLMTFFIFSLINFRDTIVHFGYEVNETKVTWKESMKSIFMFTVYEPIKENLGYFKKLLATWRRREVQRLIEAAKVSAAMTLTVGFSYLIGIDKASLSGPGIIAFVSGSNPVEAVQASVIRLTACILGTVLGFFAGTFSTTPIEKVASMCVLCFVSTFFRYDKDYAIIAIFGLMVSIPLNSVTITSTDDTIQRMNQITFGIFIYIFISALVLPLSPSSILRKKRMNILVKVSETLTQLSGLFSESLPTGNLRAHSVLHVGKQPLHDSEAFATSLSLSIRTPNISDMSTRLIVRKDHIMENIEAQLSDIERRLKATYPFLGFSRQERGLVDRGYPVKACEKTSFHLYRMICLLRTMWSSWNVLRSQRVYSPEMHNVLQILQPMAWDASRCFSRFVEMICCELRNPSTSLKSELMQVVLEFIQTVEELCLRKNYIMVTVINNAVEGHRPRKSDTHAAERAAPLTRAISQQRQKQSSDKAAEPRHGKKPPNASILPHLRKGTKSNLLDETASSLPECEPLSQSFVMPIGDEYIEGLHSFALSLQMFADETKEILMSLEEMVEYMRVHA